MTVPETAMNEEHLLPGREDHIGPPWQAFAVEAISIPESMKHGAKR